MLRVTFSPEARRDLIEITDYLCSVASPGIARKYQIRIQLAIDGLRDIPSAGPPRREFGSHVRMLIVRPYLIFYESLPEAEDISILRILHGARDIHENLIRGRT
jgi:plasmid stabilization system protein ParE